MDLANPQALLEDIAPGKVIPSDSNTQVDRRADSAEASTARMQDGEGPSIDVRSSDFGRSTVVSLDASLAFAKRTGDFDVYLSADKKMGTYTKPSIAGAQIIFAIGSADHLGDLKVQLPIVSAKPAQRNGLMLTLTDDSKIYVMAPWARDAIGKDLATHYEVDGDTLVQRIDTTGHLTYPILADPAWTYVNDYGIGTTTPGVASAIMHGCFSCYFPVPGAPSRFPTVGTDLPLMVGPWSFHCTFGQEATGHMPGYPTWAFEFEAASGHVDGLGSYISFGFFKNDGESTYTLEVFGYIVNDNPTGVGRPAYLLGASAEWAIFASNMSNISIVT
ncbi:hypothetical protein E3O44_13380 [Cryobacterium algoricola]|uniref:Uncharacterized protein n=1 Tax=Cryobacterium algoricola TaxID=1259183 RepID=A0ABY2IAW2_9MICO|nr:hypothetical protein [Cryobacterium algoricola]TFB85581.1 hypothetical protein E3O44_13380 [Cryobacterium algoricola]